MYGATAEHTCRTQLKDGQSMTGSLEVDRFYSHYDFRVGNGCQDLRVELLTFSGDVDLYVTNVDDISTAHGFTWHSRKPGKLMEVITVLHTNPEYTAGLYRISVLCDKAKVYRRATTSSHQDPSSPFADTVPCPATYSLQVALPQPILIRKPKPKPKPNL